MTDCPRQFPSRADRTARRLAVARAVHGFTLVEMLVVIAVIVLAMTLAIPAIRSLTGSRSVEAAENAITAYLGQVRAEAIGQQKIEGVMFLLDTPTDRIMCVPVQDVTNNNGIIDNPPLSANKPDATCVFLDAIRGRDPYFLPAGIRLFTTKDQPPTYATIYFGPGQWVDAFPNWRYLGPNYYPVGSTDSNATTYPIGVILFGADGKLLTVQYGLRLQNGTVRSALGELMYNGNPGQGGTPPDWPAPQQHYNHFLSSQVGFVLVDKESFMSPANGFVDHDNPNEQAVDAWLDANTSPIIINRYDGTLMRAE